MIVNRLFWVFGLISFFVFSSAFAGDLNDPTKPIYSENASSSIVTNRVIQENKMAYLQSIFIGKDKKVAVLNGRLVQEGRISNDMKVIAIHSDYIVVRYKESQVDVRLSEKIYFDKVTGEIRD